MKLLQPEIANLMKKCISQLCSCVPERLPVNYNSSFNCFPFLVGLVLSTLFFSLWSFARTSSKGGSPGLRKA